MNYNSIQDLINADVTNMICLRNNVAQDDGVDSVQGVNWFTFLNVVANTIYVSGNSFFGFGANTEHLKVNRQDAKMWYLYREEGTLYGYYNFLKIRWSGYSTYSANTQEYKLTYDVILFDNGDIMLHVVDIPTVANNGTYTLVADSNYNYTVNASQPDITFYKQETGGYIAKNELSAIQLPFENKFLIKNYKPNGFELLTVSGDAMQVVPTLDINAQTFRLYGFDKLPPSNLLLTLKKFDVLLWYDSAEIKPNLNVAIKAIPPPQTIITELIDMSDNTIKGIEKILATATGNPLYAVSFDNKSTWDAWSGTEWMKVDNVVGMTGEMMKSISADKWAAKVQNLNGIYLKFVLHNGDVVNSVVVNFVN